MHSLVSGLPNHHKVQNMQYRLFTLPKIVLAPRFILLYLEASATFTSLQTSAITNNSLAMLVQAEGSR